MARSKSPATGTRAGAVQSTLTQRKSTATTKKTDGAKSGAASASSNSTVSSPAVSSLSLSLWAMLITSAGGYLLVHGGDVGYALFVLSLCVDGLLFARFLHQWLMAKDVGTEEMRAVADPIREGSEAFLKVMYGAISKIAVVVMAVIFFSYQLRPEGMVGGVNDLGSFTLGALGALSFAIGAGCSAVAGYVSMWVAAQSNIRVASAARRSYMEALIICFRGGAFSAILVLALCVVGVTLLHTTLYLVFVNDKKGYVTGNGGATITGADVPLLCVGYGFGASFVALFMQLGGGIFTKAADVGSDMVGKIEAGIPEDDCRNPAVIADLVGDMVGDCVGSSADVFESVAAEIIG
jgi:Na+/H+-translocating membrane pyrophosphatase